MKNGQYIVQRINDSANICYRRHCNIGLRPNPANALFDMMYAFAGLRLYAYVRRNSSLSLPFLEDTAGIK